MNENRAAAEPAAVHLASSVLLVALFVSSHACGLEEDAVARSSFVGIEGAIYIQAWTCEGYSQVRTHPAPDRDVHIRVFAGDKQVAFATTDQNGTFRIELAEGTYDLWIIPLFAEGERIQRLDVGRNGGWGITRTYVAELSHPDVVSVYFNMSKSQYSSHWEAKRRAADILAAHGLRAIHIYRFGDLPSEPFYGVAIDFAIDGDRVGEVKLFLEDAGIPELVEVNGTYSYYVCG